MTQEVGSGKSRRGRPIELGGALVSGGGTGIEIPAKGLRATKSAFAD